MSSSDRSGYGNGETRARNSDGKSQDVGAQRTSGAALTVVHGQRAPRRGFGRTRGVRTVELRVPARTELLAVVRAMTGALANYEELDGETAAELALAVDAAGMALIGVAAQDATLVLVEDPRTRDVNVRMSTACEAGENDAAKVALSGFSRRVLEALTDEVDTFSEDAGRPVFGISLTARRR